MEDMNELELGSYILVIVGALNWGLEGLGRVAGMDLNVVDLLASAVGTDVLASAIYLLVGLAGLYQIYFGYSMYEE
ncbi:MAG: DUF378 domain-containing protein [Candidatus Nanosalina sp.]